MVIKVSRDDPEVKFPGLLKFIDREQKADRVGTARHRDDYGLAAERKIQPAPLGQQIADKLMHGKILPTKDTKNTKGPVFVHFVFFVDNLILAGKRRVFE